MKGLLNNIFTIINNNNIPLIIFFSSLFFLLSFAGTRLFLSDEGVILDQFYNLIQGSLSLKLAKISTAKGMFWLIGDDLYGKFSHSLLILSLPAYFIFRMIDGFYGAHLFMLQLWAVSGGVIVYLIASIRKHRYAIVGGMIAYIILVSTNLFFFTSINFPKWGEVLSIEFTNIIITSFSLVIIYYLFKDFFGNRIAIFASFFVLIATPLPLYALTLKHHSLSVFLTLLSLYCFHKYHKNKVNIFMYISYLSAGLCIWTRIFDGAALLISLIIADIITSKRDIKYIRNIVIIILISLIPFFSFNYMIMGSPFSVIENTPELDTEVTLFAAKDFISFDESSINPKQVDLMNKLGYTWRLDNGMDWIKIFSGLSFLKLLNTFSLFLVSPFLIIGLFSIISIIKKRLKFNYFEKFLLIFSISFILLYSNYIMLIVTHTPSVLENRYLLVFYIILLYFSLKIEKIRELLENNLKIITILWISIFLIFLAYFILMFPIRFLDIYYYASLLVAVFLMFLLVIISLRNKNSSSASWNRIFLILVALSISLSSIFMLFYYWVVSMTYVAVSQNYPVIPILALILNWMYQNIIL